MGGEKEKKGEKETRGEKEARAEPRTSKKEFNAQAFKDRTEDTTCFGLDVYSAISFTRMSYSDPRGHLTSALWKIVHIA